MTVKDGKIELYEKIGQLRFQFSWFIKSDHIKKTFGD